MKSSLVKCGKLVAFAAPLALASCFGGKTAPAEPQLTKSGLDPQLFADTINGKATGLYTLTNANGMEVCITNLGGRIVSLMALDRDGNLQDVVLGMNNVKAYANLDGQTPSDYGSAIGRYANRIGGATYKVGDEVITLPANDHGNCLHGGFKGWQYQVYDVVEARDNAICLQIVGEDGEGAAEGVTGFPGKVTALVTYTLSDDNQLRIDYEATVEGKPTVINMTNHSYFCLSGKPAENSVCQDSLWVNSTAVTPTDELLIPTGEIAKIEPGSAFDFTTMTCIADRINMENQQLQYAGGIDHNWVLDTKGDLAQKALVLYSPVSGIELTEYTTEPGVQVYTANFQDGKTIGKDGKTGNPYRSAVCLESQKYPDTPNKPEWPSAALAPGETYQSTTIFAFSVR